MFLTGRYRKMSTFETAGREDELCLDIHLFIAKSESTLIQLIERNPDVFTRMTD